MDKFLLTSVGAMVFVAFAMLVIFFGTKGVSVFRIARRRKRRWH